MFSYKKASYNDMKKKAEVEINNWTRGREKYLNVVTLPFNSSDIFCDVIARFMTENKKILYITNEEYGYVQIVDLIKKKYKSNRYTYIKSESSMYENVSLYVTNFNNMNKVHEKFDLVVYDDIRSFPKMRKEEIAYFIERFSNSETKRIAFSIESIFDNKRDIIIPVNDHKHPLVEPRVLTTKIDMKKDMPYVAYEFLKWYIDSGRKLIIYVPDSEKAECLNGYITKSYSEISKNVKYVPKKFFDKKIINNLNSQKRGIILTDDYMDSELASLNTDVMVFFADDTVFNYKSFVYYCGKAGKSEIERSERPEVIFFSNSETDEMELAKNITRNFNKEAWDMGLINI